MLPAQLLMSQKVTDPINLVTILYRFLLDKEGSDF